jgi:branched-chain amino acid transport system permease protein
MSTRLEGRAPQRAAVTRFLRNVGTPEGAGERQRVIRLAQGPPGDAALIAGLAVVNLIVVGSGAGFIYEWFLMLAYVVAAMGVNITAGWTGRLSFGHALFFAGGGYIAAKLAQHPFPLGAVTIPLLCGLGAAVASVPISLLAHKRRGVYFSVLTLIIGQIVYSLVQNWNYVGGGNGIANVYLQNLGPVNFIGNTAVAWYLCVWTAVIIVVLRMIYRSSFGLACRAVRDDGLRADMLGVPTSRLLTISLAISAFATGVAGAMLAYAQTTVSPTLFFWSISGTLVVMCLLGGRYSVVGPAIGAVIFILIQYQLFANVTNASDALIGASFLLIVLVLPSGLIDLPRALLRWRREKRGSPAGPTGAAGTAGAGAVPGAGSAPSLETTP